MKMYQVDAFTQVKFKGNPAAVLVLDEWLSDELMQNIALENNLAETAFVKKIDAENFAIRWFTPTTEVDFCGHATLASSFVLFQYYAVPETIYFHVKQLGVFIVSHAEDGRICMNFPIRPAEKLSDYPPLLRQALSKPFKAVYLNAQAYIIEYETVQDVLDEKPNFELLKQLAQYRTAITADASRLDLAITAQSQQYDCISRYFAPANGINEDPVTGSIHTAIAPLWAEKLAKTSIMAYQASARGGTLYCEILADNRIEISGYAQLYLQAELYL
ncbi:MULTISPECIES: PhzF family phenazine biosynthesis protein [unclassified Acinetobacter]|uniref:PhzF family phenazine biosynthesis protein n=1 Tax=unclassified Acinetobacter TaxID=196816 RepID=UPI0029341F99|nr:MULTISPECIES: PhzF family phenazine biosynthesis protein [unclassified Acinetobacter]WOE32361.1 PhzF family phenazine biosynthesis protein [Acinetobacter sp. SAAs470]WOE37834.1 PhzF family phenazine biosynthesis protein [Acinetobacter sp. SAAs474]